MALAHSPKIVTDGLVLCLDAADPKSYPGSGTAWTDRSGNSYNGTLVNGPTFDSANGGSIDFDGTNDYGSVTGNDLNFINNVTLEVWAKYTTVSNTVLVEKSSNNTHYQLQVFASSQGTVGVAGEIVFMLQPNSSNWVVTGEVTNDGTWHHYVGTYNRSTTTAKVYVNGVLKNTNSAIVSGPSSNSQALLLGSRSGSSGFGGNISRTSIYNRDVTAAEVLQNYNATKGRFGL